MLLRVFWRHFGHPQHRSQTVVDGSTVGNERVTGEEEGTPEQEVVESDRTSAAIMELVRVC